jgi:hypothetical protein
VCTNLLPLSFRVAELFDLALFVEGVEAGAGELCISADPDGRKRSTIEFQQGTHCSDIVVKYTYQHFVVLLSGS